MEDRLRAYPDGTPLDVLAVSDSFSKGADGQSWLHVRAPDGLIGYVPAGYTANQPPPPPAPVAAPAPPPPAPPAPPAPQAAPQPAAFPQLYARQYAFMTKDGEGKEAVLEAAAGSKGGPLGIAAALARELLTGKIVRIAKDTRVQLLDPPGVRAHVEVLDGPHVGRRGITMSTMLSANP
jgi:hypothetical protein